MKTNENEENITTKRASITWMQFLLAIVFTTQAVFWLTSIYKDLKHEVERTTYVDEATKRRDSHVAKEADYERQLLAKQMEIANLKQDLREMEEDVDEWKLKYDEIKNSNNK